MIRAENYLSNSLERGGRGVWRIFAALGGCMPSISKSVFLASGFLFLLVIVLPTTAYAFLNGDVQGDGELNVSDVQCLVLAVLDLEPDNPETTPGCLSSGQAADVNCSEDLNVVDVQLVVQLVLGLLVGESGFPQIQDLDSDNVHNDCDSCPNVANSLQEDSDGDGLGDLCDETPNGESQCQALCGDVDGNGEINQEDMNQLSQFITNQGTVDECSQWALDVNSDGAINLSDVLLLGSVLNEGDMSFLMCGEQKDCAGVAGGEATKDDCGVCDDDPSNDNTTCCVPDCTFITADGEVGTKECGDDGCGGNCGEGSHNGCAPGDLCMTIPDHATLDGKLVFQDPECLDYDSCPSSPVAPWACLAEPCSYRWCMEAFNDYCPESTDEDPWICTFYGYARANACEEDPNTCNGMCNNCDPGHKCVNHPDYNPPYLYNWWRPGTCVDLSAVCLDTPNSCSTHCNNCDEGYLCSEYALELEPKNCYTPSICGDGICIGAVYRSYEECGGYDGECWGGCSDAGEKISAYSEDCTTCPEDCGCAEGEVCNDSIWSYGSYGHSDCLSISGQFTSQLGTCEPIPEDCAGVENGSAEEDKCGVCDDNPLNDCLQGGCEDEQPDCYYVEEINPLECGYGGYDGCCACGGGTNTNEIVDCAGVLGGIAKQDDCGVCDYDPVNNNTTCEKDCVGVWGGAATLDECGFCDDDPSNDNTTCELDCAGVADGLAYEDECGVCVGGETGLNPCVQDCAGVWGGAATLDECGVCDDDPSNDGITCCEPDCTFITADGDVGIKECGDDGCGGNCGEGSHNGCAPGELCTSVPDISTLEGQLYKLAYDTYWAESSSEPACAEYYDCPVGDPWTCLQNPCAVAACDEMWGDVECPWGTAEDPWICEGFSYKPLYQCMDTPNTCDENCDNCSPGFKCTAEYDGSWGTCDVQRVCKPDWVCGDGVCQGCKGIHFSLALDNYGDSCGMFTKGCSEASEDCSTCPEDCGCEDGLSCIPGTWKAGSFGDTDICWGADWYSNCPAPWKAYSGAYTTEEALGQCGVAGCGDGLCGDDEDCSTCAYDCPCALGEACALDASTGGFLCQDLCAGVECSGDKGTGSAFCDTRTGLCEVNSCGVVDCHPSNPLSCASCGEHFACYSTKPGGGGFEGECMYTGAPDDGCAESCWVSKSLCVFNACQLSIDGSCDQESCEADYGSCMTACGEAE